MEWSAKSPLHWDWENPSLFGGKEGDISFAVAVPMPAHRTERGVGTSGSVSVDSSSKEGGANSGTSVVVSAEPVTGLRLGKRTYFEDVCAGSNVKSSSTPASIVKKGSASSQSILSCHCQVEGCNIDLTGAKDYHRKHRVCEDHSKSPKVVVAGRELRFCQQCSRFHELSEFDQKKRSCRRRLSDHNARRRKPQRNTIAFNSSSLCSPFYDDTQQINFHLDRFPSGNGRPTTNSTCENPCGFSLTHAKGSWIKSSKTGSFDGQLHFPKTQLSDTVPLLNHDLDKLLPLKGTAAEILNQGLEASIRSSNFGGAPDLQHALSLLSNDSWGSANPMPANLAQFATPSHGCAAHSTAPAVNATSGFYHDEPSPSPSEQSRVSEMGIHSNGNGGQYQDFRLFKAPYGTSFFDSSQMLPRPDGQFLDFRT